jgi:hypothetical protein
MPTSKPKAKRKRKASNAVRSTRLYKANARSRLTNNTALLANVDGRTFWVRRYRDVVSLLLSDQGGEENVSQARKILASKAACLAIELERRTAVIAETGEATNAQIEVYGRTANTLRRLLQTLGLERRMKPVQSLGEYLAERYPVEDITPSVESEEQESADG